MATVFADYPMITEAFSEENHTSPTSINSSFFLNFTPFTTTEQTPLLKKETFLEEQISKNINRFLLPLIVFIGVPGNITSFIVLVFSSLRRSTTSVYLAVISVLDTIVLGTATFYYINSWFPELGAINDVSCKVVNAIFYTVIHYDVLLIVAVTAERFVVVVFPLKAQLWISMRKTVAVIVGCGVFAFGLNLCHAFIRKARFSKSSGKMYCGSTGGATTVFFLYRVYPWIDSIMYCILPMSTLFFLNMAMLRRLKNVYRTRQSMQQLNAADGQSNQSNQRQMTTMLLLVSISFLILTGPIGTFLVVRRNAWTPRTPKEKAIMGLLYSFINNLAYTNHAINFVFYCFSGQRFRNELKRMCTGHVIGNRKQYQQREVSVVSA